MRVGVGEWLAHDGEHVPSDVASDVRCAIQLSQLNKPG